MLLLSRTASPCAMLLLLCGCVESFPPHFANPMANATCFPSRSETEVCGSGSLARIWKDPSNLSPLLRSALLSPHPWRRVPRWPNLDMHLTSPSNSCADNARNARRAEPASNAVHSTLNSDTASRVGGLRLRSGHETENSNHYSTASAEGTPEEMTVVDGKTGTKVEDLQAQERQTRIIDVLESSSGLDLDGDKLVAGEYQVGYCLSLFPFFLPPCQTLPSDSPPAVGPPKGMQPVRWLRSAPPSKTLTKKSA